MKIREIVASAIMAVSVLSLTACGDKENITSMMQDAVTSNISSSNYGNSSTPPIQDEEKEATKELGIWDVLPEIPVTDASAFEYKYNSNLGGMVVTNYLNESPKIRLPDKLEGEPVVEVNFKELKKRSINSIPTRILPSIILVLLREESKLMYIVFHTGK